MLEIVASTKDLPESLASTGECLPGCGCVSACVLTYNGFSGGLDMCTCCMPNTVLVFCCREGHGVQEVHRAAHWPGENLLFHIESRTLLSRHVSPKRCML